MKNCFKLDRRVHTKLDLFRFVRKLDFHGLLVTILCLVLRVACVCWFINLTRLLEWKSAMAKEFVPSETSDRYTLNCSGSNKGGREGVEQLL